MFIIMTPVLMAPAIAVLYWGQRRARRLGAFVVADPGYAQRQVLTMAQRRDSIVALLIRLFWQVDIIGLVLLGFALGLFLVPFSLASGAEGGFSNREYSRGWERLWLSCHVSKSQVGVPNCDAWDVIAGNVDLTQSS